MNQPKDLEAEFEHIVSAMISLVNSKVENNELTDLEGEQLLDMIDSRFYCRSSDGGWNDSGCSF
jgi:hypothetical protein